jgi:serine/threonine-protein kinase
MELLDGMDLDQMVRRFGPLPAGRVVMLLEQACRSLTEAHEHGLIHRDIKPANLFITALGPEYDFLKVLDFGMVKTTMNEEELQLTAEGMAQGTPAFMPPELALGALEVDGRADLYSLGCVAYWMLTGMLVFDAKSHAQMLMQHVQSAPKPPSELAEVRVPAALERIVLRCLEKSPDDRPASAAELAEELGKVEVQKPWTQERARNWWMRYAPDELGVGPTVRDVRGK